MFWNIALLAFLVVFISSALLSLRNKGDDKEFQKPVEGYLLARGTLKSKEVISLLLSTSFGLNYLFYQIWAGYSLGIYSLLPQSAWVLGLILLSKYSSKVKNSNSLHQLLGERFEKNTRQFASLCSIVGILFMLGWETGIGVSSFTGIFKAANENAQQASHTANILIAFIVFGSLFYTLIGGLKGNANVDIFLNLIKVSVVTVLAITLFVVFTKNYPNLLWKSIFPSYSSISDNFGIFGLITSILFSIVWQFVDNSTWQTLRAAKHESTGEIKSDLLKTGIWAFVAPGIIGTLIGIALISDKPLAQEATFAQIIALSPMLNTAVVFCIFAVIIACVMSLVDGLFLNTAYTLVIDFLHPKKDLSDIDISKELSENTLLKTRLVLLCVAPLGLWGTKVVYQFFSLSTFDCFYLMMIPQLALIGPVFFVLTSNRIPRISAVTTILITLFLSYFIFYIGAHKDLSWIKDGTGSFEIFFSLLITYLSTKKP